MIVAKEMIDVAVEAGVDAIKFQSFKADKLILRNIEKAPYQKVTTIYPTTSTFCIIIGFPVC